MGRTADPAGVDRSRGETRIARGPVPPVAGPPATDEPRFGTESEGTARGAAGFPQRTGTWPQGRDRWPQQNPSAPRVRLMGGKVVPGTRYRIVRWLGEGAMGVVYEAEHIDIERRVALKILRFDLSGEARMAQVFKDEARAASRLGSQFVVEIYDFGELPDGRLFFVMELMRGKDLVPAEPGLALPQAKVLTCLRQVCKGLAAAHAASIVHRDVKPENLIMTRVADGREVVKLVDFGVSAMLAAGHGAERGPTGTPHYMAPEQILSKPFDRRLDVYALGCTAYELLTGRTPFDADTIEDLLEKHLFEPPIPPRKVRPDLGIAPALEAVVLRCMAKEPSDRYPDMAEVEAALCEAQIAAKLVTEWDDLPLPQIPDAARRTRIQAAMPTLAKGGRSRWVWPVVTAASTFAAAVLAMYVLLGRGPTEEDEHIVETLTQDARAAAANASWVAPPRGQPNAPTAYAKVRELEGLEGAAAFLAAERGRQLRSDFANTLLRQGDELWEHGAKQLAFVHYLNALVFDEGNVHAIEQLSVPTALVADYLDRAKQGELTTEERTLTLVAAAEVEDDPRARETLEGRVAADLEAGTLSQASELLLARAAGTSSVWRRRGRVSPQPTAAAAVAVPPPTVDEGSVAVSGDEPIVIDERLDASEVALGDAADPLDAASPRRSRRTRKADEATDLRSEQRDPERAAQLAEEGKAALALGQRTEAMARFNQAISFDRGNAEALMGLSDIYFDTGADHKAVVFAEKAVSAAPSQSGYRLKLGDAYFKALRYKDALAQYEEAKTRGSSQADSRIDKVRAKIGG